MPLNPLSLPCRAHGRGRRHLARRAPRGCRPAQQPRPPPAAAPRAPTPTPPRSRLQAFHQRTHTPAPQVKQKWGLSMDAAFRATSNARNEAMFREASIFAAHLRQVEKDLTSWERGIECECPAAGSEGGRSAVPALAGPHSRARERAQRRSTRGGTGQLHAGAG